MCQNGILASTDKLFWCFRFSGWDTNMTIYWCPPNEPHARITGACLRSTMVHYLGQDWNPLCKDFQLIYIDHHKDYDWKYLGELQQSTLPTGILQCEGVRKWGASNRGAIFLQYASYFQSYGCSCCSASRKWGAYTPKWKPDPKGIHHHSLWWNKDHRSHQSTQWCVNA